MVRVLADLNQVRVAGRIPDQFSMVSQRPYPYYSEGDLISQGKLTNLYAPWDNELWPGTVPPPPIPSLENERFVIHDEMRKIMWPYAGTFNKNREDRIDLGQFEPFLESKAAIYGILAIGGIIGAYGAIRGNGLMASIGGFAAGFGLAKLAKSA